VWTNPPPGAYTLSARAIDLSGSNAVSSRVSLTVEAVSAAARFVSSDSSQQGSWAGVYGAQGYFIAGDSTNQPAYVAVNNSLPLLTWASFTTDPRAMQHAAGDDRIAAAWYGYSNIVVDVRFSDTSYHRLSLYCLNWYNASGAETVDVVDNVTGAVLDHQLVPPFANGVYETWDLRGHVRLVISRSGSAPACFSGVFLDAAGVLPPVAITNIVQQTIFAAGANISVIADAAADPNNVTRVDFYDGATFLGTAPSGPPYAFVWTNASIGQHTLVAREVGPGGSTNSAPMALSVLGANTTSFMNSTLLPNGGLQLNAFGPVGKPVVVWYATNLGPTAVWLPLLTNVPAANRFSINISDPAFYPRRYYRISSAQ
jgi:hypothetical protein